MKENQDIDKFLKGLIKPIKELDFVSNVTLKDFFASKLEELNISQRQVEILLEMEHKTLDGILTQKSKRIDVVNLIKLSHFLNISLENLVELCIPEMSAGVIGNIEKSKKSNFIISNFDVPHLRKAKFIKGRLSNDEIEKRITQFFGFQTIEEYTDFVVIPAFARTKKSSNDLMRDFWVKSAYVHFEGIKNPNDYDRDSLVELIPKIRPYTMNVKNGLITVIRALYNLGVTVIYQPKLPNVQAYGATFVVYGKPCIVLTDLNKNYPTLWFALMHELHHVLYDFEEISKRVFHITGMPDLFLIQEEKANEFSREYLFSSERSKYIEPLIYNSVVVDEFSKASQVHPSFAYNFYNYDKSMEGDKYAWSKFKNHFPDVKLAIQDVNSKVWDKESIEESVAFFKEKVFNINS